MMNIRQTYRDRGYVPSVDVLTPQEADGVRRQFDLMEAQWDPQARSVGMLHLHLQHEFLWSLATHPRLLDAIEQIVGPDLILLGTHFFVKYPGQVEAFVAWHQDATYWGLEPNDAVTAWVAIDDADAQNGCMRVVPGSHRGGLRQHGKSSQKGNLLSVNQALELSDAELASACDVPLQAGQMSLHDGLLIHGSNPNGSTRRRAGYTVRVIPAHVKLVGDARHKHSWKPILVRGQDRFGHHTLLPPPFAPSAAR